ncbi:SUN domain-containing protein 3-like [Dunckerocampus dactyliophorus]|uniref:SUN domain-containing protein 3-like n=1 Tax=Dunckerocampus dactyliophorus TaxID=161453 RepID=UPI002405D149|nr:SUN domain-containing protein 3-like [Dunckerocampus dactyliophorus]
MLRKSSRLESSGYYTSDGQPVISYKETPYRKLWTRSRTLRHRRVAVDDVKYNIPLSASPASPASPARTDRAPSRVDSMLRFARKHLITILISVLWLLCESSIRQMTGFLAPSYLFSGRSNELSEEAFVKYNELLARVKAYEQQKDDKAPPWASVPNFALKSAGASVVCAATSKSYKAKTGTLSVFGFQIMFPQAVTPSVVIEGKSELIPGHCWAFSGHEGNLTITLSHPAVVQHVTLGHISKRISPTSSIPHAPNVFSVYGMETLDATEIKLGTFQYDQDGFMFQNFNIPEELHTTSKYLTLSIHSNWGDPTYTCLYSLMVHGRLAS